jgi:hypothetical protein
MNNATFFAKKSMHDNHGIVLCLSLSIPYQKLSNMRRRFLFAICLLCIAGIATGQYYMIPANINPGGNPGGLNTDQEVAIGQGFPPGWTNIDPMSNSPEWSAVQNIPFPFQFNGLPVTQYKVSNTGVLTFTTSATTVPGTSNNILPSPGIPDKSVCFWGLAFSGTNSNDRIFVKTFGTAPNRQHWIQYNSYNFPSSNMQWTYIYIAFVLEESTNNIYVVDQRSNDKGAQPTMTIGLQIDGSNAVMAAGSPNLGTVSGTSKTPVDNRYYTFIHGSPPQRDLGVSWFQIGSFLILHAGPFEFKGKVKNYTNNFVTSYDINYSVDNGPPVTSHQTGAAHQIPGFGEEWFIHTIPWTPPGVGVYEIKIWADNINGGNDENHSNDTLHRTIEVSTAFTPKMRLFEQFTSSMCEPCKDANDVLNGVLNIYPNEYALINYPMNYPGTGDPYHTAECDIRKAYYFVDSIPDMIVHGDRVVDPLYIDTLQFNDLWDKSYLMFNPTHTIVGNTINITASILPFQTFNQGTLVVRFAVVEKTTTGNVGNNGQTLFRNTFKKFIPDAAGVNLGVLQEAVFKTVARSYTFPTPHTIENWSNLAVIVFVQDEATKEVYQANFSQQISNIDNPDAPRAILSLAPNPALNATTLYFLMDQPGDAVIEVYNMNGQLVKRFVNQNFPQGMHQQKIDLDGMGPGLYLVKLHNGTTVETTRLIVQ